MLNRENSRDNEAMRTVRLNGALGVYAPVDTCRSHPLVLSGFSGPLCTLALTVKQKRKRGVRRWWWLVAVVVVVVRVCTIEASICLIGNRHGRPRC